MTWAKFDDLYDDNRKIKRAWRRHGRAVGLHCMAVTYCARHETDGIVDLDWISEKLPNGKERAAVLRVLVDVELFAKRDDDHYIVKDYLQYNASRAELEEKRAKDAERKARGRNGRGPSDSGGSPSRVRPDTSQTPSGVPAESARPVPSRPVEEETSSSSSEIRDKEGDRPEVDKLCSLLVGLVAENAGAKPKPVTREWRRECRLLLDRDGRTVEQVRWIINWCQADQFWKGNVRSMPKLREQFDQLVIKAKAERARPNGASASLDDSFLAQLNAKNAA